MLAIIILPAKGSSAKIASQLPLLLSSSSSKKTFSMLSGNAISTASNTTHTRAQPSVVTVTSSAPFHGMPSTASAIPELTRLTSRIDAPFKPTMPSCAQLSGKYQLTKNSPVLPISARRSTSLETISPKSRAYSLFSPSGDVGVIETAEAKYAHAMNINSRMSSKKNDLSRLHTKAKCRTIYSPASTGPNLASLELYLSLADAYIRVWGLEMAFESAGSICKVIWRTLEAADRVVKREPFRAEELAGIRDDAQMLQRALLRHGEYAMGRWREFDESMDRAIKAAEMLIPTEYKDSVEMESMVEELQEVEEGLKKLVKGAWWVFEP
ncbi:hypothetical protein LTR37_002401 [Vermiconidia calcicola]|uniref:Uncharacterized protein n=1 Tax=Vermiconidia calcicola TaxID=1690605 RepID=A0ACC3NSM2_9PEZI|nr:hypothetical protein LTR37_002401 [Vermiconidia calcicola]